MREHYPDKQRGDSLEASHINKLNQAARIVTGLMPGMMGGVPGNPTQGHIQRVMAIINSDDECDSGTDTGTGTSVITGLKCRPMYWDDFNEEWKDRGSALDNVYPLDSVDPDVIFGEGEIIHAYYDSQREAYVAMPIYQAAYVAFGTIAGLTVEEGVAIPGKATLPIYKVCLDESNNPELRQIFGKTLVVYNMQDQQISGRFTIVKGVLGKWFAAAACCLVVCCNLHAPAIADVVGCNCRVDLPLYNPPPMRVVIVLNTDPLSTIGSYTVRNFPFAHSPWVLGEDGEGFDNLHGQDVDYAATFNPPDDYGPFSSEGEPSPIMTAGLTVNVSRQTIVDYFPQTEDTMDNTGYVGYNAYGHIPGVPSTDIRYTPRPLLENHPVSYGNGPGIRQFRYITNFSYPDPAVVISPNRAIIYTQDQLNGVGATPFFAFYNSFNAFEIEVNIDEDSSIVLNVPPATVPAFNPEKTVQNTTEELYIEKIGDDDCTGTGTETTTQRRTIAISNTGDTGYFDGSSKFTNQIRLGIVEENEQSAWVLIRDVEIGSGNVTITGARLIFTQKELSDEPLFLQIFGVYVGNINGPPSTFAEYEAYPLWTSASTGDPIPVDWDIEGESNDGDLIISADVTSLIGAIISRTDWESGHNIMLLIKFENSTGTGTGTDFGNRKFYSSDETEEEIEPVFEYEYESVEEVCEEFYLQMDCQTVPYEPGTGTGTGDDTVSVRFISPPAPSESNGRSKAWTTVVMEGDLYTCQWYAGYDGETEEEVLAQSPMVQGSLGMYRWEDGLPLGNITDAQLNRVPILPYSPPYHGFSPATIPMSRWFPVRAWAGSKADDPGLTGTDDEQFILPNGFDWRKMCLRTSSGPDSPYVMWFRDGWRESQRGFFVDEYQCVETGT